MRWLPAFIMMGLIFLFSSIPSKEMPAFGGWDTVIKKSGHMLGYGFLTASFWRGIGGKPKNAYLISWLLAMVYALSDELHQGFVPGRHAAIIDLVIDGLGITIGVFLISRSPKIQEFLLRNVV